LESAVEGAKYSVFRLGDLASRQAVVLLAKHRCPVVVVIAEEEFLRLKARPTTKSATKPMAKE
jgi:hypothetical protein